MKISFKVQIEVDGKRQEVFASIEQDGNSEMLKLTINDGVAYVAPEELYLIADFFWRPGE